MDSEVELHAIFYGRVQGVGFRWHVQDLAIAYQLKGTVKNLIDGSVELYATGAKENLESFLKSIQNSSGAAKVTSIKTHYQKASSSYSEFKILH